MKIKTLIVEDEPVARRRIKRLLASHTEIEIVGEAADGNAAVALFRETKPDLLFLDIQIPGVDGFGVLEKLAAENASSPVIIFTTAYNQHALRAFEFEALDYLLKPFDRERFQKTVERAKKQIQNRHNSDLHHLASVFKNIAPKPQYLERILIKKAGEIFILKTDEIDWIEAAGDYMKLRVGKETHLVRETMSGLEEKLDPEKFIRIQRSIIVNIERIKKLHPMFRGDYVVELEDETRLNSSRHYRHKLQAVFGKAL